MFFRVLIYRSHDIGGDNINFEFVMIMPGPGSTSRGYLPEQDQVTFGIFIQLEV